MAKQLSDTFKEQFVVENRPGANGAVAADAVAKAPKDGYTLFMAALPNIAITPAMQKVSFDAARDFAAVSNVGLNPFVLAASTKLAPVKTLAEFIAHVKAANGALSYGSGGVGSLGHLSMALLLARAGLKMDHVPYQGGGPAMNDVVAGQLPFYFANLSEVLPHANTGSINILAVSSLARIPQLPDAPTVAESGFPGFRTLTWNGLLAPAGTPRDIVNAIAARVAVAVKAPDVVKAFDAMGVTPVGDTPEQFRATIAEDIALWAEAVKLAGLEAK
jgi:tripartite-type tricarboxylate transporter receptor subunit TctC